MKLSTGDIIEIEVCAYPDKKSYLLNGLRYDTVEVLIKEFLFNKYLFTPDLDDWFGLKSTVRIFSIGSIWRRLFAEFLPPLYTVHFDGNYTMQVFFSEGYEVTPYETELKVLGEMLEMLINTPPQKQICTIYS
jgi:hypothetical protein